MLGAGTRGSEFAGPKFMLVIIAHEQIWDVHIHAVSIHSWFKAPSTSGDSDR